MRAKADKKTARNEATKFDVLPAHQRLAEQVDPKLRDVAIRTAFVARFIVLREGRRSRAHRLLEKMSWSTETTANQLVDRFRQAFLENGDKIQPIDRDLQRALRHAERSAGYFFEEYVGRATLSFEASLLDYERSNVLLFGEDGAVPRTGGWRLNTEKYANEDGEDDEGE